MVIARQRTALVIGNAAYGELGVLRNPVNDATDIGGTLPGQLGFAVTLLRDVDRRTMIEAIDAFSLQLRQGGRGILLCWPRCAGAGRKLPHSPARPDQPGAGCAV